MQQQLVLSKSPEPGRTAGPPALADRWVAPASVEQLAAAGKAAAAQRFALAKQMEQGKQQARERFERVKADQERQRVAEQERRRAAQQVAEQAKRVRVLHEVQKQMRVQRKERVLTLKRHRGLSR